MTCFRLFTAFVLAAVAGRALAAPPETVPVAGPANKADTTGFGAVPYEYKIGKYEVTNAEFCEFLNAVAKADPHKLYDGRMAGEYGGIERSGDKGHFTYTVKDDMAKKPINFVTFETACRYCNWLSNGQGKGDTETGAYEIKNGKVSAPDHAELAKGSTAKRVIPSENEWYKAAYYDPRKTSYWQYPGGSNEPNEANINTNAPSAVGQFTRAASPYGTFDQGGNVWEYNDARQGPKVGLRGGSFYINDNDGYMRSGTRYDVYGAKWPNYGFRVAVVGGSK